VRLLLLGEGSHARGHGHLSRLAAIYAAAVSAGHTVRVAGRHGDGGAARAFLPDDALITLPDDGPDQDLAALALARWPAEALLADLPGLGPLPSGVVTARLSDPPHGAGADLVIAPAGDVPPARWPTAVVRSSPAWLPLRPAFSHTRWRGPGHGVLVIPGGTDATGLLPRLLPWAQSDWSVAGPVSAPAPLRALGHLDAAALAHALANARAVVCTASTSALEAWSVGVPFIALRVVDNQDGLAATLAAAGIPVVDGQDLERLPALLAMLTPPPAAPAGAAARVVGEVEMLLRARRGLLRPATWDDAGLLLRWAADPAVAASRLRPATLSEAGHYAWFAARCADPACRLWIGRDAAGSVGTVRLDRQGDEAVVSISVAPERRGQGWGLRLLTALADEARAWDLRRLVATVRDDNPASLRLFRNAGYQRRGAHHGDGAPASDFVYGL
jgi:RimJ/RimL family protein N-acetyltransferase